MAPRSLADSVHGSIHGVRTSRESFFSKIPNFGLVQTNWAENFGDIWGIFGRFISTHFGTVSPMSMFSKKATKFDKISTVNLRLCSKCQIDGEDFVN